jgi:hypothetical protein
MDSVGVGNNGFAIDHSRIIPDFFGASRQIIGHITHIGAMTGAASPRTAPELRGPPFAAA